MAVVSDRTLNAVSCHMRNIGRITDLRYCGLYLSEWQLWIGRLDQSPARNDRLQYKGAVQAFEMNGRSGSEFPLYLTLQLVTTGRE